jgi:hypothetical protein
MWTILDQSVTGMIVLGKKPVKNQACRNWELLLLAVVVAPSPSQIEL